MSSTPPASADTPATNDTTTTTEQTTTQQRNNNRNSNSNNQRNNDNRGANRTNNNNNRNNQSAMDVSNKNFEGAEPEIGCVIGLKYERIDKKVTFEIFREKMCNYIERKIEFGTEISGLVKDYENVLESFKKTNLPSALSDEEAKDDIEVAILKEEISLYVKKKAKMKAHIQSIYAKIWGQRSEALQNMVKYLKDYENNEKIRMSNGY